ncbi:hypothetical protein ACQ4PT_041232 [Festuca glaucescens]
MTELMRVPKKLRRAQDEVRGAFAGQIRVREEALPELRYLLLVIKETLRLHPAVPLLVPRECQEPCRVLGYDVPVGAMVLVNAWAIGPSRAGAWTPRSSGRRGSRRPAGARWTSRGRTSSSCRSARDGGCAPE